MKYKLDFFKQDGKWYADVPSRSLEDNEMVFGSDDFLETVADGKERITLNFADQMPANSNYLYGLKRYTHDDEGAEYVICYSQDDDIIPEGSIIWICNVTHDVCGEHPEMIYITDITNGK